MMIRGPCLVTLLGVITIASAHARDGTARGPKFFVIGTYIQPDFTMANWKSRGINTLVQQPDGHKIEQWSAAATQSGLYMIRPASQDLHADLSNPLLLAWAQSDEPSNTSTYTLDYGKVFMDPSAIEAQAAPWRAAAKAEGKFVPVWANHVGAHIYPNWAPNVRIMKDYMEGPESDWLASDSYPIQNNQPLLVNAGDYTSTQQGVCAFRQIEWSGGKSTMTFIGSAPFSAGQDVPTPAELKAQAWSAIINGAVGIIYFSIAFTPSWNFDATPPELVVAMTDLHKEIKSIEKVLIDETAGGRRPYTVLHAANPDTPPKAGQLPFPFEATEIKDVEGTYRIILNLSDKSSVLNIPEWGLNNVTFNRYEVKRGYNKK